MAYKKKSNKKLDADSKELPSDRKKGIQISQIVNLVTTITAILSLIFAYVANKKADKANTIAEEANTIAKEANRIASLSASAVVSLTSSSHYMYGLETCKDGEWYYFWFVTDPSIVFTNLGGVSVSLVDAKLTSDTSEGWGYWNGFWDKDAALQGVSLNNMKSLPEEIPSGVSKEFNFVTVYRFYAAKTKEEMKNYIDQNANFSTKPLVWEFTFGNGQTIQFTDPLTFSPPSFELNYDKQCIWPYLKP